MLRLHIDTGKENGNYYNMLGLYKDNGKVNENYYMIGPQTLKRVKEAKGPGKPL